jgi:crossover junction endodeoxyribonuclease RusA
MRGGSFHLSRYDAPVHRKAPRTAVTQRQVSEIRRCSSAGMMNKQIALRMRLTPQCVSQIVWGRRRGALMQTHPPNHFTAVGEPTTQGSKNLVRTKKGRSIMIESSKNLKPWRQCVAAAAKEAGVAFRTGPVMMQIVCRWPRPRSHFTSRGLLRSGAPAWPTGPDVDKLERAIFDALKGIAYRDDSQVSKAVIERDYCQDGDPAHAEITIMDRTKT